VTWYKRTPDVLAFGVARGWRAYELQLARYQEMLPSLADWLVDGETILDVGAGGGDAKRFLDTLPARPRWVGIEIDPGRAAQCRRLGYAEVHAVDLAAEAVPLPDGSCRAVIASHVLEHLEDPARAVADWIRVLAPGGVLLIGVPMHLPPTAWLMRLKYRLLGRRPLGHCQFFTMRTLRALLAPYAVRELRGFRIFSARRWLPLEDHRWFYDLSVAIGRRLPSLTTEVNVVIGKAGLDAPEAP
jgi:SAM-dependent methyltransferase